MFKKSRSKVLVDDASEEDDMSWHYDHCYKVRVPNPQTSDQPLDQSPH